MSLRTWLWLGTVLNALLFLPAAFMAFSAVGFALAYPASGVAIGVAALFVALPLFCLVTPFVAWRIHRKRPRDKNAGLMVAAPLIYAVFLAVFLFFD